jgi:large subunit ribosomal protein L25
MEEITLDAQARSTGKRALKQLRKEELVPAVYYTQHRDVHHIAVHARALSHLVAKETPLLHLKLDGKELPCVIREIQRHPVNNEILHVDFFGVERGHKIRVTVPVRLMGAAAGVKEGGILEHGYREVQIECLPHHLPAHLEVEISHLGIGDSIRIENLSFENITLLDDPHTVVAQVVAPRLEKAVAEEEVKAEAEAEAAEPEVISARREEEEGEKESKAK